MACYFLDYFLDLVLIALGCFSAGAALALVLAKYLRGTEGRMME